MAVRRRVWRCLAAAGALGLSLTACTLLTDLSGFSGEAATEGDASDAARPARDAGEAGGDGATPLLDGAAVPEAGAAYVAAVLADAPVAYYPLDESSGTIARDLVGGKDGTWVGKGALGVAGIVGSGARFDGASTRLEMPVGSFAFAGKVPYSVEVWLNPTVVDTRVRFLLDRDDGNGSVGGYKIYFSSAFFLCSRSDSDGGADGYGTITPVPSGKFVHIVMTYDGALVRLFANGAASGTANGDLALAGGAASSLVFGDSASGQFFKLAGVLDEIAIYDHALPPARVLAHYAARPH